ncbi:hypothetical protein AB0M02_00315 [Actinoplanes sp. NPDC051861]|uniref:hypothetical protein n=1 Tax=Actinoplanes sp. NPDC051861 TaxID=3155170 RepID=UPI00343805AA
MTMPFRILRWEDPPHAQAPAKGGGRSKWTEVADALREEPDRWAVLYEGRPYAATTLATVIRSGKIRCFCPTGSFAAVSRKHNDVVTVYARYVGERAT